MPPFWFRIAQVRAARRRVPNSTLRQVNPEANVTIFMQTKQKKATETKNTKVPKAF